MTRKECETVLAFLAGCYGWAYRDRWEDTVAAWDTMFADDDPVLVGAAVKSLVAMPGKPPEIGDIKDKMRELTTPDKETAMEAWQIIKRAIRGGVSMSPSSRILTAEGQSPTSAERAYNSLPDNVRRLVGSPSQLADWSRMDTATLDSVVFSQFRRAYDEREEQRRSYEAIPASVRATIAALTAKMALPEIDEGRK